MKASITYLNAPNSLLDSNQNVLKCAALLRSYTGKDFFLGGGVQVTKDLGYDKEVNFFVGGRKGEKGI